MNGARVTRWLGFHQHRLVAKLRSHQDAASQFVGSAIAVVVCLIPSCADKSTEDMRQTTCTVAAICQDRFTYRGNQVCCFASKR